MARAPAALSATLPHDVNAVIGALHGHQLNGAADQYLRHAMFTATYHVYVGVAVVALIVLVVVLFTPREFPVAQEAARAG